jgi:hypothetical protein
MNTVQRTALVVLAVVAVIFAMVTFAYLHGRAEGALVSVPHAYSTSGHLRPCPPRNKHCRPVKPPVPPAGCTWVIGGALGDIPRCV